MSEVVRFDGFRRGGGDEPVRRPPDDIDLRLSKFPLTDLGNAERFHARYGGRLLWCFELGWAVWDGRRWSFDDAEAKVLQAVQLTVRAIQEEARALENSEDDEIVTEATRTKDAVWRHDKVRDWGRASENRPRLNAVAEQARTKMSARPDDLDGDPMMLTVMNGTLRFRRPTGPDDSDPLITLLPHDPAHRITKLAPVIYDPNARAPVFASFMAKTQPNPGQQRFLAQWFGYNATGLVGEQKLVFLFGEGSNGKSTLVDATATILGDYSETLGIETFLDQGAKRKGSDASPDIAGLKGIRQLRTSEPEKKAKLAEAFIKLITGGEPIKARFLNKDFFTLRPVFKLTISGNHKPEIAGADHGIWRRIVLVPFENIIAKQDLDKELPAKLAAESSGIFNWMMDGLRDWLENGLVIPESIIEATQTYREDSDPFGRFLALVTEKADGEFVQSSVLYAVFQAWTKWAGESEWTQKGFSKAMKDRGYRTKTSNVVWWHDLRLIKDTSDFQGKAPGPDGDGRDFAPRDEV